MLKRAFALMLTAMPATALADLGNEINAGLGLRYRVPHSERMTWIADVGAYRDSGRNTALLTGGGALFGISERWRLGAALVLLDSDTYNRGKTALAPVPLSCASLEIGL
jgi:hypothetical protein